MNNKSLSDIRHCLHENPELSGNEFRTAEFINQYLSNLSCKVVTKIDGNSLAAIWESNENGLNLLFRADFDALPIEEISNLKYRSKQPGIAHLCGHDGHTAILLGLARYIEDNPPRNGKLILLFQAEEETGAGAKKVIDHPILTHNPPDYVFALHNLPGFPMDSIICSKKNFTSASVGMKVKLIGKTSHAANPENAISPAKTMARIILKLDEINQKKYTDFCLLTIIHSRLGKIAFGTTPGEAEIMATLRAYEDIDLVLMKNDCEKIIQNEVKKTKLKYELQWVEEFIATTNHPKAFDIVREAVNKNHYRFIENSEPFRWSEDFGYLTQRFPGALFLYRSRK